METSQQIDRRLSELQGVIDHNRGIHPGIDKILDGIVLLSVLDLDPERTQTAIVTLAGDTDLDIVRALSLVVRHLAVKAGAPETDDSDFAWDLFQSTCAAAAAIEEAQLETSSTV